MAMVCSVTAASTLAGSRVKVTGSISAKTGRAPVMATELAVAAKVKEGTITSASRSAPAPEAKGRQVLGGGAGVDGHAVGAAHHPGGELLLEGRHLRALDHHAAGQDGVDRGPLLGAYQRPGRGNELQ